MKKTLTLISIIAAGLSVAGCSSNISPNTYTGNEVGVVSRVVSGVIVSMRPVTIDNESGIGTLAGATAGGAAGTLIGDNTATNVAGAVGGVVVGGVVGHVVDKSINTHQGYEYIIKLDNGSTISVVQDKDLQLNVKQHVLVIYGEMTRIIADNTTSTTTSTPKAATTKKPVTSTKSANTTQNAK